MNRYLPWLLVLCLILITGCVSIPTGGGGRGIAPLQTGKDFLIGTQLEAPDYGLYSYLLFVEAPLSAISQERYQKAIEAFLAIPNISVLSTTATPGETNIAYIPVCDVPGEDVTAAWVLANYHYSRAQHILRLLPLDLSHLNSGPYIVSALRPLNSPLPAGEHFLFQDLSLVPPHLIPMWVRDFRQQVMQDKFWEKSVLDQAVLKLRTAIGILAQGLSQVQASLTDWIRLVKNE